MEKCRKGILLAGLFIVLNVSNALAQKDEVVKSLFEKRVKTFQSFFSSKPKLLWKQLYLMGDRKSTPTGDAFIYLSFRDCKISYDVRRTNSLASPYIGYITVQYSYSDSSKCGDFKDEDVMSGNKVVLKGRTYFTTLELARQKRDDESCYEKEGEGETRFSFAFQNNQWVFKDILDTRRNKPDAVFYSAFADVVKDNDFWYRLVQ